MGCCLREAGEKTSKFPAKKLLNFSLIFVVTYCPWARFDITCSKYPNLLHQPLAHKLLWLLAQAFFPIKSVCKSFALRFVLFLASIGFKENCKHFLMLDVGQDRCALGTWKTVFLNFPACFMYIWLRWSRWEQDVLRGLLLTQQHCTLPVAAIIYSHLLIKTSPLALLFSNTEINLSFLICSCRSVQGDARTNDRGSNGHASRY